MGIGIIDYLETNLAQGHSYGGYRGCHTPKQNFEAKFLNFAVFSFGPIVLSFVSVLNLKLIFVLDLNSGFSFKFWSQF